MAETIAAMQQRWQAECERYEAVGALVDGSELIRAFLRDLDSLSGGLEPLEGGYHDLNAVSSLLGVSRRTLSRWLKQGVFAGAYQFGNGYWRIPAKDVHDFMSRPKDMMKRLKPDLPAPAPSRRPKLSAWREGR